MNNQIIILLAFLIIKYYSFLHYLLMTNIKQHELYCKEIKKSRGFFANWSLGTTFQLGDYGRAEKNIFVKRGNIKESFKISFKSKSFKSNTKIDYQSEGAVSVKTNPQGDAQGIGAQIEIKFLKKNAIYLDGRIKKVKRIENLDKISEELVEHVHFGKWKKDYILINEVTYSKPTLIFMASRANTTITLEANIPTNKIMDLANFTIPFSYKASQTMSNRTVLCDEYTPLFRAVKFKQSWADKLVGKPIDPYDLKAASFGAKKGIENGFKKRAMLTLIPVES